MSMYSQ